MLHKHGIFWAPDYAVNAAGLVWVAQTATGLNEQTAIEKIDGIYETIAEIARRTQTEGASPGSLADKIVEERLARGEVVSISGGYLKPADGEFVDLRSKRSMA